MLKGTVFLLEIKSAAVLEEMHIVPNLSQQSFK